MTRPARLPSTAAQLTLGITPCPMWANDPRWACPHPADATAVEVVAPHTCGPGHCHHDQWATVLHHPGDEMRRTMCRKHASMVADHWLDGLVGIEGSCRARHTRVWVELSGAP